MSCLLITLAVEGVAVDPLGAKEAAIMAVEHLGGVRVLQVEFQEPEQLGLAGAAPEPRSGPSTSSPARRSMPSRSDGQAPAAPSEARRTRRAGPVAMACCLTCDFYRQQCGRDEAGKPCWGMCRLTGKPVYDLKDQCGSWVRKEGRS